MVDQEVKQFHVSFHLRVKAFNRDQATEWAVGYFCGGNYYTQILDQWTEAEEEPSASEVLE